MRRSYNEIAGRNLDRINALSDGLFAIAMTLIVFEIHVPIARAIRTERGLLHALIGLSPQMIMYLQSFLTLGTFWVGQQTQLNYLDGTDRNLTWLHLAFLAAVTIMPFSTELLANFITLRTALLFYWLNMLLLGAMLYATWSYAARAGLVKEDTSEHTSRALKRRIVVAQTLYAIGAAMCIFNNYWSIAFIVLVQLNYALAPRIPFLHRLTN